MLAKFTPGLLVIAVSLGSAAVQGQEDITFVSNMNQRMDARPEVGREEQHPSSTKSYNQRGAQLFTTGDARDGYKLSSVEFVLVDYEKIDGENLEASLHLFGNARNPLGKKILDFTIPTSYGTYIGAGGAMSFFPVDGTSEESRTLLPNTDYVVQFRLDNPGTLRWFTIDATDSDRETQLDYWSIADNSYWKRTGYRWGTRDDVMKMKVLGTRVGSNSVVTLRATPRNITQDGGMATVTGTVGPALDTEFTVDVAFSPHAPATASDFTLSANTTLSFAAGETTSTGTVTLTAVNSDTYTGDRSVTLSGASAEDVDIPSSTVVIEEDEDPSGLETNPTHNSAVLSWRFPYRPRTSVVEYRLSANGGSFGAWTEIPQSRPYQSHGSRYEVPNLASSTEYAFKLRYKRDNSPGPEVEAGATTFEPFTARFTDLPAFSDTRSTARSDQLFTVTGEYSSALRTSRALGPRHGLVEVDGAVYVGRDDGRDPDSFWMELRAMADTTSVAITLKAPDGPKVRCTEAEASSAPIRKLCSADLRPLSEDVTGIVRARREVRLALDTASISENGGVANLTARLYKPRSRETDPVNETSDVDVYVDVQITDEAGDVEASGTRLTIPAGSRDSNAIALTARDNGEATGNRRIAIAAGTPSEGHVALDSETGRVELEIEEDDVGLLAPDDFEATPGPEAVRLSWDPSVNAAAHTYQYRYWRTGTAPDWQDVPDSGVGGANHSGFLVSGLANRRPTRSKSAPGRERTS